MPTTSSYLLLRRDGSRGWITLTPTKTPRKHGRVGLPQEQLSFRAGLSRPYISQLERELKSPTVETLFRICDALAVSAADVVGRVDAVKNGSQDRDHFEEGK